LVAVLLAIDAQIRPMIQSMAAYQAKVFATRAINDSIAEQLSREDIQYDHLVRVSFDPSGQVSAVQTDMVRLNRLKADLTGAASDRVAELERQEIGIPLGTLVGGQFFSGRGPVVEFKVVPAGFVQSELIHRFDSAGINQTRHQIVMQLDVSIIALLPGYVTTTEVSTNVILAETVIVGVSPDSFTRVITGDKEDIAGLIADYGRKNSAK
ncbi:MAG: sporulation protein YunB, partial [Oscillospiraceae bacterium]